MSAVYAHFNSADESTVNHNKVGVPYLSESASPFALCQMKLFTSEGIDEP
jgi:hypothetical protein